MIFNFLQYLREQYESVLSDSVYSYRVSFLVRYIILNYETVF